MESWKIPKDNVSRCIIFQSNDELVLRTPASLSSVVALLSRAGLTIEAIESLDLTSRRWIDTP